MFPWAPTIPIVFPSPLNSFFHAFFQRVLQKRRRRLLHNRNVFNFQRYLSNIFKTRLRNIAGNMQLQELGNLTYLINNNTMKKSR